VRVRVENVEVTPWPAVAATTTARGAMAEPG
jgi:hypothetical protein